MSEDALKSVPLPFSSFLFLGLQIDPRKTPHALLYGLSVGTPFPLSSPFGDHFCGRLEVSTARSVNVHEQI